MNAAEREASRLRNSGLVYHERLINGECWIGPPERHPDGVGKVKILPLVDVEPKPQMRVHAHGEKYLVDYNFTGTWFDVVSPSGKALIQP